MAELHQKIYSKKRMTDGECDLWYGYRGIYRILRDECQQCSDDCMPRSCLRDPRTPEHSAEVLEVSIPSRIQRILT